MSQKVKTVRLTQAGQFLEVRPPCEEIRPALRATTHVPTPLGDGTVIGVESGRLYRETMVLDEPVLECFVGLLPVVIQALKNSEYSVEMNGPVPTQLFEPAMPSVEKADNCDWNFLELVRFQDRGIAKYDPAGVDPAWLIAQIALAWPSLSIAAVSTRIEQARQLRNKLLKYLSNVVAVTSRDTVADEEVGRVVVASYNGLGHSGIEVQSRDVVIALNAVEASRPGPLSMLGYARQARVFGLLPLGQQLAPEDSDATRLLFGFNEVTVTKHGRVVPEVIVARFPIAGGWQLSNPLSTTELKRQGIWHHHVRNRRIAWLARHLKDDLPMVLQRMPSITPALSGRADLAVLVLVENMEHGEVLARQLPGWPFIANGKSSLSAATNGSQLVDATFKEAIATWEGLKGAALGNWDVIIRADGGVGMTEYPASGLGSAIYGMNQDRRLVLIDFDDRHHPILRRWSRQRWAAYRREGWFPPGTDPVQGRVDQFLAMRPTNA